LGSMFRRSMMVGNVRSNMFYVLDLCRGGCSSLFDNKTKQTSWLLVGK
jgi:hypothetical protein